MNVILIAVIVLGALGLVSALVLFFASHKFAVHEDPRIGQVSEVLPQANCGGCGFPGCSGFAAACVKAADEGSLEGKLCPVGGQAVMEGVMMKAPDAIAITAKAKHKTRKTRLISFLRFFFFLVFRLCCISLKLKFSSIFNPSL